MSQLTYRGREISVTNGQDLRDALQLALTDAGDAQSRLNAKDAQDRNRDQWLQQFARWTGEQIARLSNGNSGASPLSLLSLFSAKAKGLSPAIVPSTSAAVPVPSPHRSGNPTGQSLDSSLNAINFDASSTDRAHKMTLDFTAGFTATNPAGKVTFKTKYSSAPVVQLSQRDALPLRNFRVLSVSDTEYIFTCDAFPFAELHQVDAIVVHPSDPMD